MKKVYKVSIIRVLINILSGLALAGICGGVALYFWDLKIALIVAVAIALLYLYLAILSNIMTVIVDGGKLIIQHKKKEQVFDIETSSFVARTKTDGTGTECRLQITEANGKVSHVDFELIGINQFDQLMHDLGIIGDNAPVTKLDTKHKG